MTVSENHGDIIYTYEFEKYRKLHSLNIYLCRKSDPETKGQVESVVKYVKGNFLPHRFFMDIDILNQSFVEWLKRTGNRKIHGTTKKVPAEVFELERAHLRPILTQMITLDNESISRKVRKDNTILYESNRYSVPLGTYNKEKEVCLEVNDDKLVIWQIFRDYIVAEHDLCTGKGKLIKNRSHSRDREHDIDELFLALSNRLDRLCDDFLQEIRRQKGRYIRDQYGLVDRLIQENGVSVVIVAISYCQDHELFSATDLKDVIEHLKKRANPPESPIAIQIKPITNPDVATVITQKRSIDAYTVLGGGAI